MNFLMWLLCVFLLSGYVDSTKSHQYTASQLSNRSVIVQLFEWKWLDVAEECERFLGPNGYGAVQVRDCKLVGLKDLNQTTPYVREKIAEYLNKLVNLGVAGFRVDAAKHMWPEDLNQIYNSVNNLNTDFGFPYNMRPFIYQEVTQGGAVSAFDYKDMGSVTEFSAVSVLYEIFTGQKPLNSLVSWGSSSWNMLPSESALVFVDNHDTQRSSTSLNYKYGPKYQAAVAFLLAHWYGRARITSSYFFNSSDQGPPSDSNENILSPIVNQNGSCSGGWVCEHRWESISSMVAFRNTVRDTKVENWWDNGHNQIAFSRGHKGFVAFNIEPIEMFVTLQTGLPAGAYCDIRSGRSNGDTCTGKTVTVTDQGEAQIFLSGTGNDLYLAIHIGTESRLHPL